MKASGGGRGLGYPANTAKKKRKKEIARGMTENVRFINGGRGKRQKRKQLFLLILSAPDPARGIGHV